VFCKISDGKELPSHSTYQHVQQKIMSTISSQTYTTCATTDAQKSKIDASDADTAALILWEKSALIRRKKMMPQ
jgi:hypothetical protein